MTSKRIEVVTGKRVLQICWQLLTCAFAAFLVSLVPAALSSAAGDSPDDGAPLFQLTVTPHDVTTLLTENLTLGCAYNNSSGESRLARVFRMRIVKESETGWDLVAEQRDNEAGPTSHVEAAVSASVKGRPQDAFLQVTWHEVDDQNFGLFRCDVLGYDDEFEIVTALSAELDVAETPISSSYLVRVFKETQDALLVLRNTTETELDTLKRENEALAAALKAIQPAPGSGLPSSLVSWPGGYYALLQPKTGCPVDLAFFGGTHRYHKMNTESSGSGTQQDTHSSAFFKLTNFKSDGKYFTTIELCEVTREFNTAPWPQGSYCIHKLLHQPCPGNFTAGRLMFDLEDTNSATEAINNIADDGQAMHFCCMNTRNPATPMLQLPAESPFFLYRNGGKCHEVLGMDVSEEFLQIDTEDTDNRDKVCDTCPDIDDSDSVMKFNLCYYTPS